NDTAWSLRATRHRCGRSKALPALAIYRAVCRREVSRPVLDRRYRLDDPRGTHRRLGADLPRGEDLRPPARYGDAPSAARGTGRAGRRLEVETRVRHARSRGDGALEV